jgi:TetR/AcrR family transcriptional regulator, transcriptional repressor for nem operon
MLDNVRYMKGQLVAQRSEKKQESRARILASAGRGFRAHGYGALGVDGIARDAGVTSGAFYAHFPSKSAAFREAVAAGMSDLHSGIGRFQEETEADWLSAFVDFYLGERRTCDPGESCALQALSGDVARADRATRDAYECELRAIIDTIAAGLDGKAAHSAHRKRAIALLAMLAGGVSMARAVADPSLSEEIAQAVRSAALSWAGRE